MVIEENYTLGDSKYITIIKLFPLVNTFHFLEYFFFKQTGGFRGGQLFHHYVLRGPFYYLIFK